MVSAGEISWLVVAFTMLFAACERHDGAKGDHHDSVAPRLTHEQRAVVPSAVVAATQVGDGPCAKLVALACRDLGATSGVCRLLQDESQAMSAERCRLLLSQPQKTLDDFRQLERSRLPLDPPTIGELETNDAPRLGPRDAKVHLVAFIDFDCPRCVPVAKLLPALVDRFSPHVSLVLRLHPNQPGTLSRTLAAASLFAHAQGKFPAFYDCVFNCQHDLGRSALDRCALDAGVDAAAMNRALNENRIDARLERDLELARRAIVGNVPYVFVDGLRWTGGPSTHDLESLVADRVAQSSGSQAKKHR